MKQALYHQPGRPSIPLNVEKENDNGTLDLIGAPHQKVTECPIAEANTEFATCTLIIDPAAEKAAAAEAKAKAK